MSLAQRTLCESGVDYSLLLESLALVKKLIDCDGDGKILKDDPAVKILKKLFATTNENDQVNISGVWYHIPSVAAGYTDISGNFYKCPQENIANSCFEKGGDVQLYYYSKDCKFVGCTWKPTFTLPSGNDLADCLGEAISKLGLDDNSSYELNFKNIANEFAKFLGSAACEIAYCNDDVMDPTDPTVGLGEETEPTPNGIAAGSMIFRHDLDCVLIVIRAFCELLKQRITLDRKLQKSLITTDQCDL